jgi:hypothetical protein
MKTREPPAAIVNVIRETKEVRHGANADDEVADQVRRGRHDPSDRGTPPRRYTLARPR